MASARIPQNANACAFSSLGEYLSGQSWFCALSGADQASVEARAHEKTIKKSSYLVRHGERPLIAYFILSGLLTWTDTSVEGRTVSFANLTAGALFGFGTLFNKQPRVGNVIAVMSSRVGCVPADLFEELVNTSIPFNHALMHDFNERLLWFRGNLMAAGAAATDFQVVRAIVSNFHPTLNPVLQSELHLTQEQVANLSGVSRQRCNQALKRLKARGLIDTSYGGITVLDLAKLRRLTMDSAI